MVFLNPPPRHSCECNCAAALREENARLEKLNASWEYEVERCRAERDALQLTIDVERRERDEARERVADLECASGLKASLEGCPHKAEVARLEGLILDWESSDVVSRIDSESALWSEARRIRAQREGECSAGVKGCGILFDEHGHAEEGGLYHSHTCDLHPEDQCQACEEEKR
jgi:hypothetical protein